LRVERGGIDLHADRETFAKANLLDTEVALQKCDLGSKGSEWSAGLRHRESQKLGEADKHPIGSRHIGIHERRDAVERVEQEMRLQLTEQRLKAGLGQMLLQLQSLDGSLVILAVVVECVTDGYDHAIDQQIERKGFHEQRSEDLEEGYLLIDDPAVSESDD
jgi:hypothetical protein